MDSQANSKAATKVFQDWQKHSDAPRQATGMAVLASLRGRYPDYAVTVTPSHTGLLRFAKAGHATATFHSEGETDLSERIHKPAKGRMSRDQGTMKTNVFFGKYNYFWRSHSYIVYSAQFEEEYRIVEKLYVLSKGEGDDKAVPQKVDDLIAAASRWSNETHEEINVFDQQMWVKDKELYKAVQSATWDDVILDKDMKEALVKDVEGFFDCKDDYEQFAVPWKRGVIFHGVSPPFHLDRGHQC